MFDRLSVLEERYMQLNEMLADPEVLSDANKLRQYSKEQSQLEETVQAYRHYKETSTAYKEAKAMLEDRTLDADMRELAKEEMSLLEPEVKALEAKLRVLLLPKDPNDDKNVIVEIRGAAGGDEAALFAVDLYKMYTRFAERQNWKAELIDANYTELGGFKEVTFLINGTGAYSKLKFENGAHRVQRVPSTESGGRIHTSTATVAVLPEVDAVGDVTINPADLRIDTFRASGAGGQHVNKTDSAVRITHLPTGIVVECQDDRSQHRNKAQAMGVLAARIKDAQVREQQQKIASERKSLIG
ncbi:MAG: peptide chain release factor 1, partial [Exiguobacterium chiriqhucha]|uniref:peptide chain release factor 1 n=1 Tax=Exiguobacterium chiriqhucha TaxID=1385984 RepID=UPI00144B5F19